MFDAATLSAIKVTLLLASSVCIILMLIAIPLAWWLANTRSRFKAFISAIVALPLILPPTVLGFYLLLLFSPSGAIGQLSGAVGLEGLAFSFWGLVIASLFYSLPFVVQPIQNAFESIDSGPLEAAACLRASPWDRFFSVSLPLAKPGLITAAILGFAHTVGEFGVVLMIGGNIPGETQVMSILIYEHVEAMEYAQAHRLAAMMLGFSFCILFAVYFFRPIRRGANLRFGA